MTLRPAVHSGALGPLANGVIQISQYHDELDGLMRFKVSTLSHSRQACITDEGYMEDYPTMERVRGLVEETALHVLLDAREKINEAIADLMGRPPHN